MRLGRVVDDGGCIESSSALKQPSKAVKHGYLSKLVVKN